MFISEFEKQASVGQSADKFVGMVKKHWGQIREGIAEGFKKGVWDPRKAMTGLAPMSQGSKLKAVAKNTTQVAKQYGPSAGGAAMLGRATKGDSDSNQTANMNYVGGGY